MERKCLKITRDIDKLSRDIYKFSKKGKRTFTLGIKTCLTADLIYVFPVSEILQTNSKINMSFKWILIIYVILIGLTIISLFPLLRKDQTLNENEANELKEIIWGKKEIGNNSKKLEIIEMFIDMIDDKIADNVLKTRRSLKAFAGFSAIFVIPLLLEIFSKMKLIDLLIILVLFVPTSYIGIFIVGRDVDTWELILTKKSFEYTNAKKELRFLKEYLKNSDKENSK